MERKERIGLLKEFIKTFEEALIDERKAGRDSIANTLEKQIQGLKQAVQLLEEL